MNGYGMEDEDLQQMYQEVILDASRHPHGRVRAGSDLATEGSSSLQGDTALAAARRTAERIDGLVDQLSEALR